MNMDLVVKTDEIPKVGETLLGKELLQIPGGKGANQGVAIAKLGKDVTFIGKVGEDDFGGLLLNSMKNQGVNTQYIERAEASTGIAVINVDQYGNNNIVVILGANVLVDPAYLHRSLAAFEDSDIVVFQLEIPLETVKEGLKIAKKLGKTTVLNPAPAMDLDDEIIQNTDILIPNEHELERISKVEIRDKASLLKGAKVLLDKGIKKVIITLGSRGALYVSEDESEFFGAYHVDAIDTTAAGDSFIAGFVASYIDDKDIKKAIDMGQRAAALTIQKVGAQSSLPTIEEVKDFRSEVTLWEN